MIQEKLYTLTTIHEGNFFIMFAADRDIILQESREILSETNYESVKEFMDNDDLQIGDSSFSTVDSGFYIVRNY